ncbi:MAG: hypothetical protein IT210_08610 [Armatimonadetes bacterium]|nr:hypothetical protein [Armatimonadota bacterium]
MPPLWRIRLFGCFQAEGGGRTITRFHRGASASLLAYLAYYRDRAHTREELIALLWPEAGPESGRYRLSLTLSDLRKHLEPPGVPKRQWLESMYFAAPRRLIAALEGQARAIEQAMREGPDSLAGGIGNNRLSARMVRQASGR